MVIKLPDFDCGLFPIHTADLYRVPYFELGEWKVSWDTANDFKKLQEMDRKEYKREWTAGEGSQMQTVTKASELAGYGDLPQVLREACGTVGRYVVDDKAGLVTILDNGIGPGLCAEVFFNSLSDNGKDRVYMIGFDPSMNKLSNAEERLNKLGVKYKLLQCSDYEILRHIDTDSIDILINIAGGTHHNMLAPWGNYKTCLKPGGVFINADWDVDFWIPIIVYDMCMNYEWPRKEEFDEKFRETFLNEHPLETYRKLAYPTNSKDIQAIRDMSNFWVGYGKLQQKEGDLREDSIWNPEGHIHPKRKIELGEAAGLKSNSPYIQNLLSKDIKIGYTIVRDGFSHKGHRILKENPHHIVPDSTLWNLTMWQNI